MLDFDTGVKVGQAIEKLASHDRRMDTIEADHEHLQTEVTEAKTLAIRVGLVVMLWLAGLAINLPAEKGGEMVASFLKAFLK